VLRDRRKIGELDATEVDVDDLVAVIAEESRETEPSRQSPETAA
jgi:galactofuranose transport system ATP-binding protein